MRRAARRILVAYSLQYQPMSFCTGELRKVCGNRRIRIPLTKDAREDFDLK
jgi:hypothetical protein